MKFQNIPFKKILLSLLGLIFFSPAFAQESSGVSLLTFTDPVFLIFTAGFILVICISYIFSGVLESLAKAGDGDSADYIHDLADDLYQSKNVIFFLYSFFYGFFLFYFLTKGTPYESHVVEWMNLIVRWIHVVFGIAWIGASFYFVFLENALNRTKDLREELAGNLWAIHGGGFYYLEKYKIAPKSIPKDLHWFKYEAYFTWVSGFALLTIVYYLDAKVYLIDPRVLEISPSNAILIGVGSLIGGWFFYDTLCKTKLVDKTVLFGIILFAFCTFAAWFYSQIYSGRGAYIHFGAMIGTFMVGNVFRVIIPAQKAMVRAAKRGLPLDPSLGKNALRRSLHNNYLTLPVLFVMISNHFPSTYGSAQNWFILAGLTLASALVKHYLNLLEKGHQAIWIIPVAAIGMISLCIMTAPKPTGGCDEENPVSFSQVTEIIQQRCITCHSANPTDDILKTAPNNVTFDDPEMIIKFADRINQRAVVTKTMPQANKTGMTQAERNMIGCWIQNGMKK